MHFPPSIFVEVTAQAAPCPAVGMLEHWQLTMTPSVLGLQALVSTLHCLLPRYLAVDEKGRIVTTPLSVHVRAVFVKVVTVSVGLRLRVSRSSWMGAKVKEGAELKEGMMVLERGVPVPLVVAAHWLTTVGAPCATARGVTGGGRQAVAARLVDVARSGHALCRAASTLAPPPPLQQRRQGAQCAAKVAPTGGIGAEPPPPPKLTGEERHQGGDDQGGLHHGGVCTHGGAAVVRQA